MLGPLFRLGYSSPKVYVKPQRERYIRSPVQQKIQQFKRFVENYRRHIVCLVIIYGITAGVALERCYCESVCPHLSFSLLSMITKMNHRALKASWPHEAHLSFVLPRFYMYHVCWVNWFQDIRQGDTQINTFLCRLWFAVWLLWNPRNLYRRHHRVPRFCCCGLFPVSIHAPHSVSQPDNHIQRDLP